MRCSPILPWAWYERSRSSKLIVIIGIDYEGRNELRPFLVDAFDDINDLPTAVMMTSHDCQSNRLNY